MGGEDSRFAEADRADLQLYDKTRVRSELGQAKEMGEHAARPGSLATDYSVRPPVVPAERKLGFDSFFLDHNLQVGRDVLVQFDRHIELAQRLQRLVQLDLAAIHVEALLLESLGDVA